MYVSVPDRCITPFWMVGPILLISTGVFVERVGDSQSLHTVEVSGNVGPCERPDSSFGEGSCCRHQWSVTSLIWFCGDFRECSLDSHSSSLHCQVVHLLSVVLLSDCSVARVDVETMVVVVEVMVLWIYSCSLSLYLNRRVSSA